MRDIWHLFVDDVRRLTGNVVSVIIVIGLVAIPSLFAWFNIAASWDPFGNMGAMRFAVANDDEGYQSDLIPVRVSIGAEVVDQLRADSQLDWTFTTRQDAIEGTKSGEYYAALVIPKDFSATMMTFFTEDAHHAVIEYYSNEKKNAVAPNLTGAGADEVAAQVNEMFAETLTGTALDIAAALVRQLDRPEARNAMDDFQANIADFAAQLNDTADSLATYRALTDTAQSLLESSSALVGQTATAIDDDAEPLGDARQAVRDTADALSAAAGTVTDALSASADGFTGVRDDLDTVFDDAQGSAAATADALRQQSSAVSRPGGALPAAARYAAGTAGRGRQPRPDGRGGRAAAHRRPAGHAGHGVDHGRRHGDAGRRRRARTAGADPHAHRPGRRIRHRRLGRVRGRHRPAGRPTHRRRAGRLLRAGSGHATVGFHGLHTGRRRGGRRRHGGGHPHDAGRHRRAPARGRRRADHLP